MHYIGANSYLFVNGTYYIKFKAKSSEFSPTLLCLGSISRDWSIDNMKKAELNYDFYDYDSIAVDDVVYIHKYSMKKNNMI